MITTEKRCDKCGAVVQGKEQFWQVRLQNRSQHSGKFHQMDSEAVDFCRPCLVVLGLMPSAQGDPEPPSPKEKMTALEIVEMLAELLRREGP